MKRTKEKASFLFKNDTFLLVRVGTQCCIDIHCSSPMYYHSLLNTKFCSFKVYIVLRQNFFDFLGGLCRWHCTLLVFEPMSFTWYSSDNFSKRNQIQTYIIFKMMPFSESVLIKKAFLNPTLNGTFFKSINSWKRAKKVESHTYAPSKINNRDVWRRHFLRHCCYRFSTMLWK